MKSIDVQHNQVNCSYLFSWLGVDIIRVRVVLLIQVKSLVNTDNSIDLLEIRNYKLMYSTPIGKTCQYWNSIFEFPTITFRAMRFFDICSIRFQILLFPAFLSSIRVRAVFVFYLRSSRFSSSNHRQSSRSFYSAVKFTVSVPKYSYLTAAIL